MMLQSELEPSIDRAINNVELSSVLSSVGARRQATLWPAEQECLNIILSQIKYQNGILWSARSMDQSYL